MWQAYQLDRWQHTAALTMIHAAKGTSYAKVHPYVDPNFIGNKSSKSQMSVAIPTTPMIPGL